MIHNSTYLDISLITWAYIWISVEFGTDPNLPRKMYTWTYS